MAMLDKSNIVDFSSRPRRVHQTAGRNYDGEGARTLELRGVLDVLSAYTGYEGGINCSMCGKLYKSKVCFIKHLWEHSVYWDLFPGDKNHERVLAIQAALILYSHYLGVSQEDAERLCDLLVTSPNSHENGQTSTSNSDIPMTSRLHTTPKKNGRPGPYQYPTTPSKFEKETPPDPYPVTPLREMEPKLVCPGAPRKDKRKASHMKIQRTARRRRRLLLE
ncbi:hypothetical protein MAR_025664 [Mya arenaria]|uniref:C2H2-type domain-containing protein n=1 Tax=Mya arenaria TaxID=6604 RepID=A0ABY7EQR4_MYAAR|nr:uncharacterized protein LOC128242324 [Mya arenaria]XP_052815424.1 uncharacterized protein LOC128242349 [Mya arenaria]WAR11447.1 hypothetical protein MAR_025627 [Mya arenaria]WAR11484.1 hypothetical protein MAR_025664 [Mya arenaria]